MFKRFYPGEDVDSIYDIDFYGMSKKGYRAVLFDIDNTLVPHGAPATDEVIAFFKKLREYGYRTCLISNNKEPRVRSLAKQVEADYLYKAGKPSPKGYFKAMEITQSDSNTTIFVGDQLFTDIWGANRAGIHSILVKPIHPKEEIQIVLKRKLEAVVLFFYRRRKKNN